MLYAEKGSATLLLSVLKECLEYSGFFRLRRLTVSHVLFGGGVSAPLEREVLEHGDVAAAVLYDPIRDKVVMINQFRVGAYASGLNPWLLDIVAGRIENGQSPRETIIREIGKESGLTPLSVEPIGSYLTAPIYRASASTCSAPWSMQQGHRHPWRIGRGGRYPPAGYEPRRHAAPDANTDTVPLGWSCAWLDNLP